MTISLVYEAVIDHLLRGDICKDVPPERPYLDESSIDEYRLPAGAEAPAFFKQNEPIIFPMVGCEIRANDPDPGEAELPDPKAGV